MSRHIAEPTRDVEAAKKLYAPEARWSAESVGYVLQGPFVFAKAKQSPEVRAREPYAPKRYLETLFSHPRKLKGANS
jgi:TetR/AcrR family transcriptional repressor of nem operon